MRTRGQGQDALRIAKVARLAAVDVNVLAGVFAKAIDAAVEGPPVSHMRAGAVPCLVEAGLALGVP